MQFELKDPRTLVRVLEIRASKDETTARILDAAKWEAVAMEQAAIVSELERQLRSLAPGAAGTSPLDISVPSDIEASR